MFKYFHWGKVTETMECWLRHECLEKALFRVGQPTLLLYEFGRAHRGIIEPLSNLQTL